MVTISGGILSIFVFSGNCFCLSGWTFSTLTSAPLVLVHGSFFGAPRTERVTEELEAIELALVADSELDLGIEC